MRALLTLGYVLMLLVAMVGALNVGHSLIGLWMVLGGYAEPGQPMFLDELAPTVGDASLTLAIASLVTIAALLGCWWARRRAN